MKKNLNRRTFLRAAGVCVALPALEAMSPAVTLCNVFEPPKRMVVICASLGLHAPSLFPDAPGRDYSSTPYLDLLADHRDDFTLFSGLSHPDQAGKDGHSSQMTWLTAARSPGLSGFQNSISVDQYVAENLGYVTRFPSVTLCTGWSNSQSHDRHGVMVPAEWRPSVLFENMFLQGEPGEIELKRFQLQSGQSILDSLGDQTKRLRKRISAGDRDRLDQYFESIRKAENRFQEQSQWLDRPKPKVDVETPQDIAKENDIIGRTNLLMELIPLIIQTDSSRVISVLVEGRSDVPPVEGVKLDHHNLSHHGQDDEKLDQLKRIETELVKSFGGLMGGLKSKTEGEGTLLDNTMVMFGSNLGNANSHDWRNLPIMLAGGQFNHGSYVAYDKENNTPLCNLFVSMLQEMGIESDQFASSTGKLDWS